MLTLNFSSQQSEVDMVVVLVPQTSTRHSSLSGATTNDERLSPTYLTVSCDFTTMLKKLIYVRHLAVSYGWTILDGTKVKCLVVHPVINLQKGHFKISVGHARSKKPYLLFMTLLSESQTSLQTD